jgi:hypothetical protein
MNRLPNDVNQRIHSAHEFRRRMRLIEGGPQGLPNATTVAGPQSDVPTMVLQRGPAGASRPVSVQDTSSRVSVHEILCRNCLPSIPADATACPYCRTLLGGGTESRFGWLPLSFAAFFVLALRATLLFSSTAWRRRIAIGKVNSTPQPSQAEIAKTASTDKLVSAALPSLPPTQSLENSASPLPSPSPSAQISQQAILARFVECWHSSNTGKSFSPGRRLEYSPCRWGLLWASTLTLCWKAQNDGTIQLVPDSEGYVNVTEEERRSGNISEFDHWKFDHVDEKEHRVILLLHTIQGYRDGSEAKLEFRYSCGAEGPEIECTNQRIANLNHQPGLQSLITSTGSEPNNPSARLSSRCGLARRICNRVLSGMALPQHKILCRFLRLFLAACQDAVKHMGASLRGTQQESLSLGEKDDQSFEISEPEDAIFQTPSSRFSKPDISREVHAADETAADICEFM